MENVISYIRFSTKKQEMGDSLRRQIEARDAWIAEHNHTLLSIDYRDLGVGAFRGKHRHKGALSKFLEAAKSGKFPKDAILLIEDLDRLSREGIDDGYNELFREIIKAGIRIVSLNDPYTILDKKSLDDPLQVMKLIWQFHMAGEYSKKLSGRIHEYRKKEVDRVRKEGGIIKSKCPSWLVIKHEKFVVKKGAKKTLAYMYQRTIEGIGQVVLTKELQEKYPAIGQSGKWNLGLVGSILKDRRLLGEFQPHELDENGIRQPVGDCILNYYPRMIEDGTFYKAEKSRESRFGKRTRTHDFVNVLSGIIFNANDGSPMHVQTGVAKGKPNRRFVSYGGRNKLKDSCTIGVDYEYLTYALLVAVSELDPSELITTTKAESNSMEEIQLKLDGVAGNLKTLLAKVKKRPSESLMDLVYELETEKKELSEDLAKAKSQTTDSTKNDLKDTKSILQMLGSVEGSDKIELHIRLQALIVRIIESIYVAPFKLDARKVAAVLQINFRNGYTRRLWMEPKVSNTPQPITTISPANPDLLPKDDLRIKNNVPAVIETARIKMKPNDYELQEKQQTDEKEFIQYIEDDLNRKLNSAELKKWRTKWRKEHRKPSKKAKIRVVK